MERLRQTSRFPLGDQRGWQEKVCPSTLALDVKDNAIYEQTELTMPVLAIGGSPSLGSSVADQVRE